MFPLIIQWPQLPMCCSIQPTISSHHAGEAVPEIMEREFVSIHVRHVAAMAEVLPHIMGAVIRPLRSCWLIPLSALVR